MMLVPDELCADIYNTQVAPYMTEGKALAFAHGFNIHFKTITPPQSTACSPNRSVSVSSLKVVSRMPATR